MQFVFFDAVDNVLFVRDDPETASWTVHERSLALDFPLLADKVIERGMRVGFVDPATGNFQPFEIRKVKNYEPDHYQEVTAEHIMISELTDDHYRRFMGTTDHEYINMTAAQVLSGVLQYANPIEGSSQTPTAWYGSRWALGNDASDGMRNTLKLGAGSVYQQIPKIEAAYNVRIMPRVQINPNSGITGRYLDIVPVGGSYHGVRLSLDKNMADASVQIDDTDVVTAMYAYGQNNLTLSGFYWAQTDEHPEKPTYQYFVNDPDATALFGRAGLPRFGYYQNGSISDRAQLCQKAWETLQQKNSPKITIDGVVTDLYRMGYHDEPLVLYDTVYVDIRPMKKVYALEISTMIVDLINPTQTQLSIGKFYPNIIVIAQKTSSQASGVSVSADGGGGGGSGNVSGENTNANKLDQLWAAFSGLVGLALTAGQIKDGDGTMQNVIKY